MANLSSIQYCQIAIQAKQSVLQADQCAISGYLEQYHGLLEGNKYLITKTTR